MKTLKYIIILSFFYLSACSDNQVINKENPLLTIEKSELLKISRAGMGECYSKRDFIIKRCKKYAESTSYTYAQLSDKKVHERLDKIIEIDTCLARYDSPYGRKSVIKDVNCIPYLPKN